MRPFSCRWMIKTACLVEIYITQVLRFACCCASVVYLRFVKGSPLAS